MQKKLNPDATPTHKALQICTLLLFSGKRYFLTELSERYQCSKPTVMRIMQKIEASGILPILSGLEQGKRWYQLAELPGTPHIALSMEEVERLTLCRDLIEHLLPNGMDELLTGCLAKISTLMRPMEYRG